MRHGRYPPEPDSDTSSLRACAGGGVIGAQERRKDRINSLLHILLHRMEQTSASNAKRGLISWHRFTGNQHFVGLGREIACPKGHFSKPPPSATRPPLRRADTNVGSAIITGIHRLAEPRLRAREHGLVRVDHQPARYGGRRQVELGLGSVGKNASQVDGLAARHGGIERN